MSSYKDHSVPWGPLDFNMYQRAGGTSFLNGCLGISRQTTGALRANEIEKSPGFCKPIAGAFGGLTAGAAWVACAAGW